MAAIGIIGMGNMGYAMLKGLLGILPSADIIMTDVNSERLEQVNQETGVTYVESNAECVNRAKYIVLAVKPQYYNQVLKSIRYTVTGDHVLISIAPGIKIVDILEKIGIDKRIVRAMPNTPALLGMGMSGITYKPEVFEFEEKEMIEKIFSSFGEVQFVEESLMNTVVCASGSSPAYVYMFIEALADSAVKYGMPRKQAYEFVAQTVKGAAEMVLKTGVHPGALKDQVCSPGGTTIAAVTALEEYGFRNAIMKATDACYQRASKLD